MQFVATPQTKKLSALAFFPAVGLCAKPKHGETDRQLIRVIIYICFSPPLATPPHHITHPKNALRLFSSFLVFGNKKP
jgi:hypothetical protein